MTTTSATSEKDIFNLLDALYMKTINGIPMISKSIEELSEEYLCRCTTKEIAAKKMAKNQMIKCVTSGVLSGLGTSISLPVSIPANISSVLYVQMRMIASMAYMAGYDLKSDQVQTFVYACLAGVSINGILKSFGIKCGEKLTHVAIQKIPAQVLYEINKQVGFRFVTKYGETGMVCLEKSIPVVSAIICGSLDYMETKIIANRAYSFFFSQ